MERVKIFRDKVKYEELVKMIEEGIPYMTIAKYFSCDHSSIIWHARKLGVKANGGKPRSPIKVKHQSHPRNQRYFPLKDVYIENGERINLGKTYQEYLDIEQKRNSPKTLQETIKIQIK